MTLKVAKIQDWQSYDINASLLKIGDRVKVEDNIAYIISIKDKDENFLECSLYGLYYHRVYDHVLYDKRYKVAIYFIPEVYMHHLTDYLSLSCIRSLINEDAYTNVDASCYRKGGQEYLKKIRKEIRSDENKSKDIYIASNMKRIAKNVFSKKCCERTFYYSEWSYTYLCEPSEICDINNFSF